MALRTALRMARRRLRIALRIPLRTGPEGREINAAGCGVCNKGCPLVVRQYEIIYPVTRNTDITVVQY